MLSALNPYDVMCAPSPGLPQQARPSLIRPTRSRPGRKPLRHPPLWRPEDLVKTGHQDGGRALGAPNHGNKWLKMITIIKAGSQSISMNAVFVVVASGCLLPR